jgi:hypothetical protein
MGVRFAIQTYSGRGISGCLTHAKRTSRREYAGFRGLILFAVSSKRIFQLTNFKMTFRDRIVVREIDVCALLCGRRTF